MKVKMLLVFIVGMSLILGVYFTVDISETTDRPQIVQKTQVKTLDPVEKPTVERLLELTNAERVKAGVKPLELDERLNQSAQRKVDELIVEGWDETPHVNDAGIRGITYIEDLVTECSFGSENLLVNTIDVNIGFGWWMNSDSHREALLSDKYELTGLAVKNGYVVQHFCDID